MNCLATSCPGKFFKEQMKFDLYTFSVFWHLALAQKAQAAIVFEVPGPCGRVLFGALGLTWRSSRRAFCSRLALFVF